MYYVYVLKSNAKGRHYIGHTESITERLRKHNGGLVRATKYGKPWSCIYTEEFLTRADACKREREIKKYKGGILFKKLLGLWKDI